MILLQWRGDGGDPDWKGELPDRRPEKNVASAGERVDDRDKGGDCVGMVFEQIQAFEGQRVRRARRF
jgi:hypothetical protein